MKNKSHYLLTGSLLATTALFSFLGHYWKTDIYHNTDAYSIQNLPFVYAMDALHEGSFFDTLANSASLTASAHATTIRHFQDELAIAKEATPSSAAPKSTLVQQKVNASPAVISPKISYVYTDHILKKCLIRRAALCDDIGMEQAYEIVNHLLPQQASALSTEYYLSRHDVSSFQSLRRGNIHMTYEFTNVDDSYFQDAVFIGDSRTVGIAQYAGMEQATFLCKTSLTIYDYDKKKLSFENKKTSIRDVLSEKQYKKVYLMVGINECGYGTTEGYFAEYKKVVDDIRSLQPDALLFLQGNLSVTNAKSNDGGKITNATIKERNLAIKSLANQRDIFYLDINESALCEEGALIADYTWDQVHIKAQYYPIWKEFYLAHGIVL